MRSTGRVPNRATKIDTRTVTATTAESMTELTVMIDVVIPAGVASTAAVIEIEQTY